MYNENDFSAEAAINGRNNPSDYQQQNQNEIQDNEFFEQPAYDEQQNAPVEQNMQSTVQTQSAPQNNYVQNDFNYAYLGFILIGLAVVLFAAVLLLFKQPSSKKRRSVRGRNTVKIPLEQEQEYTQEEVQELSAPSVTFEIKENKDANSNAKSQKQTPVQKKNAEEENISVSDDEPMLGTPASIQGCIKNFLNITQDI